jgi:hypothetical protein
MKYMAIVIGFVVGFVVAGLALMHASPVYDGFAVAAGIAIFLVARFYRPTIERTY